MIKHFSEIEDNDLSLVGGKGLSLGKMFSADLPVPAGFVITTEAFDKYASSKIDQALEDKLKEAFDKLDTGLVSVRSSATAEDSDAASWAGQLETYLNTDKKSLIENITKCWKSASSNRVREYSAEQGIAPADLKVAVVVQAMVPSEVSGVMFTANPLTGNKDELMIEAAYGLGEMIVQGEVTPDSYIWSKKDKKISNTTINDKSEKMVLVDGKNKVVEVNKEDQTKSTLTPEQVSDLVNLGLKIEEYYGVPQDIEWALYNEKLYILQSRPITTLKASDAKQEELDSDGEVITTGIGASAGIATGTARVIKSLKDLEAVKEGEILIAHKTTPDYVEAFSKVSGVVTESGGATCHAAIVSRELGIPAIVGTGDVLIKVNTGDLVTIDGYGGILYAGEVKKKAGATEEFKIPQPSGNDIDDMVESITVGVNDSNELWPIGPVRLMTYIDTDQSVDMYNKLKELEREGWSDEKIATLFERPAFIKTFLLNTSIVGIKGANVYEKRLKLEDQVKFVEWMLRILKIVNQNDDNYIVSRNYLWNEAEVKDFVSKSEWNDTDDKLKKALNILSVNLLALNWALFWDYFPETGHELHGPYKVTEFGPNSHLVVKEYFNMAPVEVWENTKDFPFKEVQLAQIYDTDKMYINFGNRMIGEDLVKHNSKFCLIVNGKNVTSLEEIGKISSELKKLADIQAKYVKSLEPMEIVRKGAKITYFARRKFYEHFSKDWYPVDTVEGMINILGRKFIDKPDATSPMSMQEKKDMWDPRNEILP